MALNVYQDEGPITQVCADDVEFCKNVREEDMDRTGSVISCFEGLQKSASGNSTKPVHKLDEACAELFAVAKPPDVHEEFESNLKVWPSPRTTRTWRLLSIVWWRIRMLAGSAAVFFRSGRLPLAMRGDVAGGVVVRSSRLF